MTFKKSDIESLSSFSLKVAKSQAKDAAFGEFVKRYSPSKGSTKVNSSNCWLVEKDSTSFVRVTDAQKLQVISETVWTEENDSFNIIRRKSECKSSTAKYSVAADIPLKLVDHALITYIMRTSFLGLTNLSGFKYQDQLRAISIEVFRDLGVARYSWSLQTTVHDQALFRTLQECMFLWLKSRGLTTSPVLFEKVDSGDIVPISDSEYKVQLELSKLLDITIGFSHDQDFTNDSESRQAILPSSDVGLGKYSIYFRICGGFVDNPYFLMATNLEAFIKYPRLLKPSGERPTYEIAVFNNEKMNSFELNGGFQFIFMIEAERIDEAFQSAVEYLKAGDLGIIGLKSFSLDPESPYSLAFLIEGDKADIFEY